MGIQHDRKPGEESAFQCQPFQAVDIDDVRAPSLCLAQRVAVDAVAHLPHRQTGAEIANAGLISAAVVLVKECELVPARYESWDDASQVGLDTTNQVAARRSNDNTHAE
jgi:hypothetical protein